MNFSDHLYHLSKSNNKFAVCTVVETSGSTPAKTNAKMIVLENGSIWGTIGGGKLEKKTITDALKCINKNKSQLFKHDLLHQHSMCCGGSVTIFIESYMPANKLYIFGAGHTGAALAELAVKTNFNVFIIDDRKEYLDEITTEGVYKMNLHHHEALNALTFDEYTYIAILTYDHSYDREILAACISKKYNYLGMIGSRRKTELTKKMLTENNAVISEKIDRVDMPMGININAVTPSEIAISIMAQMITIKNTTSDKNEKK